jgi:hypothetical protein
MGRERRHGYVEIKVTDGLARKTGGQVGKDDAIFPDLAFFNALRTLTIE